MARLYSVRTPEGLPRRNALGMPILTRRLRSTVDAGAQRGDTIFGFGDHGQEIGRWVVAGERGTMIVKAR